MNDLLSEKEQIEQLREWWSENGNYVVGGIVLGVALLFGWNTWRSTITANQVEASIVYEDLMAEVADGEVEAAEAKADNLYVNFAKTAYAAQARLAMARLYMDTGRDQDAAEELRALAESDEDPALRNVGMLRLAKVLLYQNKPQEVVDLLSGRRGDAAFSARFSEVLGDAYVALERYDDAADRYALALADDPALPTVDRDLIQMKINDLPASEETAVFEEIVQPSAEVGQAPTDEAESSSTGETAATVEEETSATVEEETAQ